jgi:hypothetical protein
VAATPGGAAGPAAGKTWGVTSPAARGFQAVLYLRFDTQGAGDGLEIDEDGCRFEAVFRQKQYDALPSASLKMSKDGKAVIVNLGGPRQVQSVTLNPPRTVELHRADGIVQADKAADPAGFTDVNFGVQPADGSAIAVNQVTAVTVLSKPGNPRVGIAGADLKSPAMFWPTPDAAGQLQVSASAAFAKALQAFLSGQLGQAPPPEHIDAAVVIQSDAPCDIEIQQFNVRFHRLLASFTGGGGKQVLRYTGKRVERQSVSIQLPAGASVASATVRIDESFHPGKASVSGGDLQEAGQMTQDRGIRISAGDTLSGGQRVTPPGAVTAAAVGLGVMALAPGTELAIELQSDQQGLPSGRKLADASASLQEAGQAQWVIASLENPATLPGEAFWILANAQKGAAVWLAEGGAEAARLLEKDGEVWREAGRLAGFQAVYRLLPPAAPVQNAGPAAAPAVQLSAGGGVTSGTRSNGSGVVFDIAALLNASLAAARAASPEAATATIPLVFTAGAAGLITVYPPHIAYDV